MDAMRVLDISRWRSLEAKYSRKAEQEVLKNTLLGLSYIETPSIRLIIYLGKNE